MAVFDPILRTETVTISSSGTVSSAVDVENLSVVGIIMPATFTGTTITFQVSDDNSTFQALYNANNTAVSMSVTQGRSYGLVPGDFAAWRYIKVVSSSTEGTARVIKLMTRELA
jgi:hypothetical protein